MHYLAFVLVPRVVGKSEMPKFVANMLEPYNVDLPIEGGVYPENPSAEWDEWWIGGRWDGMVSRGSDPAREGDEGFESKWARNTVKVSDLPPEAVPAVVVTPDGRWHDWYEDVDRGGDWSEQEREWDRIARAILAQHREYVAVAVDFHSW
jgi:hypothetical protein